MGYGEIATLVSLAATAASAGMSYAGQSEQAAAEARARDTALAQQAQFQKQASGVFDKSLAQSGSTPAKGQIAAATNARAQSYQDIGPTKLGDPLPQRGDGNNIVVSGNTPMATAQSQSDAANNFWNQLVGGAQAKLGGYSDWNLDQNLKNADAQQQIGVIDNEAHGAASIVPDEMAAAAEKGQGLVQLGGLVGALGKTAGTVGSTWGTPTPATSTFTTGQTQPWTMQEATSDPLNFGGPTSIWARPGSSSNNLWAQLLN